MYSKLISPSTTSKFLVDAPVLKFGFQLFNLKPSVQLNQLKLEFKLLNGRFQDQNIEIKSEFRLLNIMHQVSELATRIKVRFSDLEVKFRNMYSNHKTYPKVFKHVF